MKKSLTEIKNLILTVSLLILLTAGILPTKAEALSISVDAIRVGLAYSSTAAVSAQVDNVSEMGSGFEFGYYDARNNFVPIGASTDKASLTALVDKNVCLKSGKYSLLGTSGETENIIGCYHIRYSTSYTNAWSAQAAADAITYADTFVRYESGKFYVCAGSYINSEEARKAATANGITSGYSVNCGTSYTVTVVETGTTDILFEFDWSSTNCLGIRPSNCLTPVTLYNGICYYGSFSFPRISGGNVSVINVVDIDSYAKCSIPYEVYTSWPIDALKAQAICAKNYALTQLGKHSSQGFDICSTSHCQTYKGTTLCTENSDRAVDEVHGQFLTYNGKLCKTYYTKADGGASESIANVWDSSMTTYPYLKGKTDIYEAAVASKIKNYNYTLTYSNADVLRLAKTYGYPYSDVVDMKISKFSDTGNPIQLSLTDSEGRTYIVAERNKVKSMLGAPSQRFTISDNRSSLRSGVYVDGGKYFGTLDKAYAVGDAGMELLPSGKIYAATGSGTGEVKNENVSELDTSDVIYTVTGTGSGHNVGMSQWGAYAMCSVYGKNYEDILKFYFDGSEITTVK